MATFRSFQSHIDKIRQDEITKQRISKQSQPAKEQQQKQVKQVKPESQQQLYTKADVPGVLPVIQLTQTHALHELENTDEDEQIQVSTFVLQP